MTLQPEGAESRLRAGMRASEEVGLSATATVARRSVGGAALIAVAIVELVSSAASVDLSGRPRQVLDAVAANPSGLQAEGYLGVLLPVLLVPGVLATLDLAPRTGRNLIYVGSCLFLIGGIGHAVVAIASLALLPLVAPGTDRAQTSTLVQPIAMNAIVVGLPLLFLAFVGGLVWVIGLWRAKFVGLWALVLYAVWFLVQSPLGRPLTSIHLGLLISEVPFAVVIGWIGITLIRRRGRTETVGQT
jgi:hypothetical protein